MSARPISQLAPGRRGICEAFQVRERLRARVQRPIGDVPRTGADQRVEDGERFIDWNGDGTTDWSFSDQNFHVQSLRVNAVLRWEYRPGSTLFVVWSQARANFDSKGDEFDFGDDLDVLFSEDPEDVFLIKVSKWFSP